MPTRQQGHIDKPLTNMSVAWMQQASGFVADKVFPMVPVQKQSDRYFVYSREDFYRDEARIRKHGAESEGSDYDVDNTPSYFCNIYAHHKDVTEEDRTNYDTPLDADDDAQEFVSNKLLLRREKLWVTNFFVPGVWTSQVVGVTSSPIAGQTLRWDDPASTPIEVIDAACTTVKELTGYRPNKLTVSEWVFNALKNHPDILDRIKYTQKGMVTRELLASLFELDEVLVASAVENTAVKGQNGNFSFFCGKHALLTYSPAKPALKKPSAGYIFTWKGLLGAGAYGNRMIRIPMDWLGLGTERIEGEMAFDQKVVCADLGYFFQDIVS